MKAIIFSLGGSVIVPKKPDYLFLKKFKDFILRLSKKSKVVIVCGGGKTARDYIKVLEKAKASIKERCFVGIESTKLNALLLATFLGKKANQNIPSSTKEFMHLYKKFSIVVTGGGLETFHIGTTSDGTTAYLTAKLKAKEFINLTNVNGVYNKNPLIYKDAKLIKKLGYKDFEKLMHKIREKPGQHFILDSYALKIIKQHKIKVAVLNGKNLKNVDAYLKKKSFVGSMIEES